ncbi:hypothetical protein FUAX_08260 [Fulvitalea axinellae]|uniref:VWA domain-containing protein n=1 Tax=Fulvitalea axinellae TaxID=1182444 RepID=A0AAU9CPU9_9BACT|nr:hypothetical protein FUAX_08260 [Fulvitalea axinellae]
MENFQVQFGTTAWFAPLAFVAGALYAWILYRKTMHWSAKANWLMAGCRFFVVSLMVFLLMDPVMKQSVRYVEKPELIVAIDNSESVRNYADSATLSAKMKALSEWESRLSDDYDIHYRTLSGDGSKGKVDFDKKETDLSSLFSGIDNDFEGNKIAGVVLLSDGIYNKGFNPVFRKSHYPVHVVPVGDTIAKPDLRIRNLRHNKVAYEGNLFRITAEVEQDRLPGKRTEALVRLGGKVLARKALDLEGEGQFQEVHFDLSADSSGLRRYRVELRPVDGEFTLRNNTASAYVEVISGKRKVLVMAQSAHPDIKAIRSVIESNQNYETDLWFAGRSQLPEEKYDLLVLHRLPASRQSLNSAVEAYLRKHKDTPRLFVGGTKTDYRKLSSLNDAMDIRAGIDRMDEVTAVFNPKFTEFNFDPDQKTALAGLPPLSVPFGTYNLKTGAKVVAYQRVGKVVTDRPLIVVSESGTKTGVITGEGFWRWDLHEKFDGESVGASKGMLNKLAGLLGNKEDKRQFKVYPERREYDFPESVVFDTEFYNQLFEPVYGKKISLSLRNSTDSVSRYSFVTSPSNNRYRVSGLEPGSYRYTASLKSEGKDYRVNGRFTIKENNVEATGTTADHNLLRKMAGVSGGQVFSEVSQIAEFKPEGVKGTVRVRESFLPLVNLVSLFVLLMALLSFEWFLRKYLGAF